MTQSNAETAANLPGTLKSNGNDTVTNLAKTPKIPPLEKLPVVKKHKTTIHKFHVKITFTVPADEDVCIQEKFVALLALSIQQFPATVLQP
eukprot:1221329-Ditylum_brightwellii.AAC.1